MSALDVQIAVNAVDNASSIISEVSSSLQDLEGSAGDMGDAMGGMGEAGAVASGPLAALGMSLKTRT